MELATDCASFDAVLNRERAKDLMPPGQESLVIIVDYKSTTLRTNPSISVASKVRIRYGSTFISFWGNRSV